MSGYVRVAYVGVSIISCGCSCNWDMICHGTLVSYGRKRLQTAVVEMYFSAVEEMMEVATGRTGEAASEEELTGRAGEAAAAEPGVAVEETSEEEEDPPHSPVGMAVQVPREVARRCAGRARRATAQVHGAQ